MLEVIPANRAQTFSPNNTIDTRLKYEHNKEKYQKHGSDMLKDKIPALIKYINDNKEYLNHQKILFNILEGDLLTEILERLRKMLISERAFSSASKQAVPVNILRRITDKLSKCYSEGVERVANSDANQMIVDYYVDLLELDTHMTEVNRFFNVSKYASCEPYFSERRQEVALRVIMPHQHLVYSDDVEDTTYPTVFIKIMGTMKKEVRDTRFSRGTREKEVEYYFVYSDDEFLAFDSDGEILKEYTDKVDGVNPFGIIPQTYVSRSRHLLMPMIDTDTLQLSVIIAVALGNLTYASHFLSHSVFYAIDLDAENLEINPDSFWILKSDENGQSPQIGTISPNVDSDKVLTLIQEILATWLETRNIRVSSGGRLSPDNATSGVSLMIKEMDTTADRNEQIKYFKEAEMTFWDKLKVMHNYWVDNGFVSGVPKFSDDFYLDVTFPKIKPIEDMTEIINRATTLLREGLITKFKALKMIFPEMSDEIIDEMLIEIEDKNTIELPQIINVQNEAIDAEEHMPDTEN